MMDNETLFKNFSKKIGMPVKTVEFALSEAISSALREYFETNAVSVDFENRRADLTYTAAEDMELSVARLFDDGLLPGDPFAIAYEFNSFPKKLIKQIKKNFHSILSETKSFENYNRWKSQTHKIVQGVITERCKHHYMAEFTNGQKGKLTKQNWVPKEVACYTPGKSMWFYVLKVNPDPTTVYLSRSSIHLPALLLKSYLPLYRFKCTKRYIGHISFIETDMQVNNTLREVRDLVQQELNGEAISFMVKKQIPK